MMYVIYNSTALSIMSRPRGYHTPNLNVILWNAPARLQLSCERDRMFSVMRQISDPET